MLGPLLLKNSMGHARFFTSSFVTRPTSIPLQRFYSLMTTELSSSLASTTTPSTSLSSSESSLLSSPSSSLPSVPTNAHLVHPSLKPSTTPFIKLVAAYKPLSVQSFVRDFITYQPMYLAKLSHSIYAVPLRPDILHRCVCWQRNAMRQGTHATKNRSQVRGSTRKLRGQKKSGRARVGSIRSPIFRKGGTAHGPVPRTHFTELQGKVRELGLRIALSSKFRTHQLVLTTNIELPTHYTKDLFTILNQHFHPLTRPGLRLAATKKERKYSSLLIVSGTDVPDPKLYLASQNLPDVKVISAPSINVLDIIKHEYLVMDQDARKWVEWRLGTTF